MPNTYHVRKSGNDTNDGLSAGNAWLTIDKAANTVAAGDTVYIGSGFYPELVTMDTSGTSGNPISFIGDFDGSQTGDAGPVIISAYDDPSDIGTARQGCWNQAGKEFVVIRNLTMIGPLGIYDLQLTGNRAYEGVVIEQCVLLGRTLGIDLDLNQGAIATSSGLIIRNCVTSQIWLRHDNNASAHVDVDMLIENVDVHGYMSTDKNWCLAFYNAINSTYSITGVTVRNVNAYGCDYGIAFARFKDTGAPSVCANCVGSNHIGTVNNIFGVAAAVDSYDNMSVNGSAVNTNVTLATSAYHSARLAGGVADLLFYRNFGWSPFVPCEPMSVDGYTDPAIDNGNATHAAADDIIGQPRPMNRGDDIGVAEARTRPTQETASPIEGSISAKFEGAGYQPYIGVPVNASSTTISVKAKYDANYAGTLPQLKVTNIPGVADQVATMTAAANTEETLSVTFTPTAAGVCNVELISNDTSADGVCWFDVQTRS